MYNEIFTVLRKAVPYCSRFWWKSKVQSPIFFSLTLLEKLFMESIRPYCTIRSRQYRTIFPKAFFSLPKQQSLLETLTYIIIFFAVVFGFLAFGFSLGYLANKCSSSSRDFPLVSGTKK